MIWDDVKVRDLIRKERIETGADPLHIWMREELYDAWCDWVIENKVTNCYALVDYQNQPLCMGVPVRFHDSEDISFTPRLYITEEWRS